MNEELLTRLVGALESIDSNLSDIAVSLGSLDKNIDGCISVSQNSKSRYICISGDIYTNENASWVCQHPRGWTRPESYTNNYTYYSMERRKGKEKL